MEFLDGCSCFSFVSTYIYFSLTFGVDPSSVEHSIYSLRHILVSSLLRQSDVKQSVEALEC